MSLRVSLCFISAELYVLGKFRHCLEEHHRQCFLLPDRGHEEEEAWLRERVAPRGRSGSLLRAASAEENGTEGQSEADREIGFPG